MNSPSIPLSSLVLLAVLAPGVFAQNGVTERVSVNNDGTQFPDLSNGPVMNADGRYATFVRSNGVLYLRDRERLTNIPIASGKAGGFSFDGKLLAFSSNSHLVPQDTGSYSDIFVRDNETASIEKVSVAADGSQARGDSWDARISGDGRFVAFVSEALDLVLGVPNRNHNVFVRDRQSGVTEIVNVSSSGVPGNKTSDSPSISSDGRFVAFAASSNNLVPGDTNNAFDIFVRDRQTGTTEAISVDTGGYPIGGWNPSISADGRFVAYWDPLGQIVVRDRRLGISEQVSVDPAGNPGNHSSTRPQISADGRYVLFTSSASNLVPGDTNEKSDVFRRDRQIGTTLRVSVSSNGAQSDDSADSFNAVCAISADGRFSAFVSYASNLVPGDTNNESDVFVYNAQPAPPGYPQSYCEAGTNSLGCAAKMGFTGLPSASGAAPFCVTASNVPSGTSGFLFYSLSPGNSSWHGQTLCLAAPFNQTPEQFAFGFPLYLYDCSGVFTFDFNEWIRSGADPSLVGNTTVYTQYGYLDPDASGGARLTDALQFTIQP